MNRDEARDYIRGQIDSYLQAKGSDTRKPFRCLNPAHNDTHPSMSLDRDRNKAHCFTCGADYDTFDLIGIEYGLTDDRAIFAKAYELYGIEIEGATMQRKKANTPSAAAPAKPAQPAAPAPAERPQQAERDYTTYFEDMHRHITETDYPQRRGLTEATINRFKLGYDAAFKDPANTQATWKALIIPTGQGQFVARNTDENAGKSDRVRKRGPSAVFNLESLQQQDKPVIIVEGEIDALSVIEAGGEAIGLGGTQGAGKLLKALEGAKPAKPLLICLDNDEPGREAQAALTEGVKARGIPFLQVDINGAHKDANEALTADRAAFTQAVKDAENTAAQADEDERREYLKTSAAGHIDSFLLKAIEEADSIPTGFEMLDEYLDGGLRKGLYIIGAIPSLGKTTFALQIADNIAEGGRDVLIFSLEMARAELMAKSMSRLSLTYCFKRSYSAVRYAKTVLDITSSKRHATFNDRDIEIWDNAKDEYEAFAKNIFISEGIGNIGPTEIRAAIEKHKRITGNTPVIIVDYLQIIAPYNDRATDKQNTDKAVLELKRMSRDYETPIVGISSFNRDSYSASASMTAFKESGAIEYGSDVLMALQLAGASVKDFDVDGAKAQEPRQIELKILKNRNGPTGKTLAYEYYAKYNFFAEKRHGRAT